MNTPEGRPKDIWELIQRDQPWSKEPEEPEISETGLDPRVFSEVESEEEVIHALYKALRETREPLVQMMKGKRELDPDEFKQRSAEVRELEYRIEMHPILYRLRRSSDRLHIKHALNKIADQSTRLKALILEAERELGFLKKSLEQCENSQALLSQENLEKDWPIKGLDFIAPLAFHLAEADSNEIEKAMKELTTEKREQLETMVRVFKVLQRLETE